MCLYPKIVKNPKYKPNKKNGGEVPHMQDARVGYLPIGCGKCMECMRQKSNAWKVRLMEDIKEHQNGIFVTLTFSDESYAELASEIKAEGYALDNAIAKLAVRRFLELWRKHNGKSVRHWLVTELGQNGTENIHLHGIIYTDKPEEIQKRWRYGYSFNGKYVSGRTVNYIAKYVTKADPKHKTYQPIILCSAGIGGNYTKGPAAKKNKYKEGETKETYKTAAGKQINMPIYWRNKLYSEDEREKLWLEKLDKGMRYIDGNPIKEENEQEYYRALEYYRKLNTEMGYGSPQDWDVKEYEEQRRKLKQQERIERARKT